MFGNVIDVDLVQKRPLARIHAMQGETKVRTATFKLLNDGVGWIIPEEASVTVHYRRVDGSGGSYETLEDGTSAVNYKGASNISVWLSNAVCAKAGTVTLTVELKKDGATIVTWPVLVLVSANPGCQDPVDYVEAVKWPANKYLGTDEKGNVVAKTAPEGGEGSSAATYTIDATEVLKVDFAETEAKSIDITESVNAEEIIAAANAGNMLRLKFLNADNAVVEIALDGRVDGASYTLFTGIAENPFFSSYCQFELGIRTVDEVLKVGVEYHLNPMAEKGQAEDVIVKLDLSGYYDGIIKRIYADGGESNLDVTFDANGNPIKFSNGVEEFTVVWPAEGA